MSAVDRMGARAAERAAETLAERMAAALPGLTVAAEGSDVVVSGPRLAERRGEAGLAWPAGVGR
jgi:hypothetical protein